MVKNLRLFYLYRFLGEAYFFIPALWLFLQSRGLSATRILLLNSVFCAVVVLFEVPTGALADRVGRRLSMMLGSLAMAAACLCYWASHGFFGFAVGEALLALGFTLSSGADSAYLYDGLKDAARVGEYQRREGTASAMKHAGYAVACAMGGLLATVDLALPYLVTAGACVLAFFVAWRLGEPPRPRATPVPTAADLLGDMRRALGLCARRERLRFAILLGALLFVLARSGLYLYQPKLKAIGFGVAGIGLTFGVINLVAAWASHRVDALKRWMGERTLIWVLPIALVAGYLVLGVASTTWCATILLLQSAAGGASSPLVKDLVQREIADSRVRATVLSVESLGRRLAFGLFTPALGLLIDRTGGLSPALLFAAGAGLVGTVLLLGVRLRPLASLAALFKASRSAESAGDP
jgi:MFS family permease